MNLAQPAGRDGERMTVRGKAASGENSVFARAAIGKQRVGLFGQRGKDEDMRHRASLAARAPITSGLADASPPWCCRLSSRSEEHTSELQSLMRISYAVFC